jgi:hydrogenase maturation protein HypF
MCARGVNAPLTSSLGRLFDAVAAILGLRGKVAFEGQAAMELEMIAEPGETDRYALTWSDDDPRQIAVAPIIAGVVEDIRRGMPAFVVSAKFHNTIVHGVAELCDALRREIQLDRVVLSGGCFQNKRLLEGLRSVLTSNGFKVYCHRHVPTNDGGIALGQAMIAAASSGSRREKA